MFLHLKTRVDLCLYATRSRLTESTRESVRVLTFSCYCLLFGDEGSIFFLFDDSFEGPFGLLGARQPTTTTTEA